MSDKYGNDEFEKWINSAEDSELNRDTAYSHEKYEEYIHDYSPRFKNTEEIDISDYYEELRGKNREIDEKIKLYIDRRLEEIRPKPKKTLIKTVSFLLVGSLLGSFVGLRIGMNLEKNRIHSLNPNAISISSNEELNIENAVAIKATPSVVAITVKYRARGGFFGMENIEAQAIGSGVVISENGYILTNAHVVTTSPEVVNVLFHDNSNAEAKIIWKDETLDLAIIKTNSENLTPIELADSDNVRVGDKAIAIGNPVGLNLQSTLTSGYISGLNRTIKMEDGQIMDGLFQTDASINSGNSGGALLNRKGQLIGINTAKVRSTDGIGFAIPVNTTKQIISSIIKNGNFKQVLLGIRGINLEIYKQHSLARDLGADEGVFVSEIVQGGSADKSGIKSGDIIIKIDDKKIESMNKLKRVLLNYKQGDTVKITVVRDGKKEILTMTFQEIDPNI